MGNVTKKIKEATEHISLSSEEKALMRERLVSYMGYKPLRKNKDEQSAFTFGGLYSFFRARHYSGAFMIAAIALSSTFGVSFAAADALPGDLLYGVKVNINEEIKTVFISDESRIAWDQERAERRLVEASQLAAEGRLDGDAQEKVSKLFAEHTGAVVERVLAYEETDPVLAAEASSVFEDSLETHEAVLARLIVETEGEPDEGARDLVEQVRTATMEVEKLRTDAEEKIDITEDEKEEVTTEEVTEEVTEEETTNLAESANLRVRAAYRAKERAEELLVEAEAHYMELEVDSELRAQAEAQTAFGKILMDKGAVALTEYDLSEAYSNYRQAAAAFQKVSQLLEVAKLFSVEIYPEETQSEIETTEEVTEEEVSVTTTPKQPQDTMVEEEESVEDIILRIQDTRSKTEELIIQARTQLLTHEGYDISDVEEANSRIKEIEALTLRGEIAMVLEDHKHADTLFTKALELAELTMYTLEKEGIKDNVKGVTTTEEEVVLNLEHRYSEGVHTYRGVIESDEPCNTLEGIAFVAESYPEQIALEITAQNSLNEEGCIEVTTVKEFVIKTAATKEAVLTTVIVNGSKVEWSIVEVELTNEEGEEGTQENPENPTEVE